MAFLGRLLNIRNEMPEKPHDPLPQIYQKIWTLDDAEIAHLLACRKGGCGVGHYEWSLINRMMDHYLAFRGREHLIP